MKRYRVLLVLTTVFLLTLQPTIDLDLGWHLRYGEYFWKTGQVLKENIISSVWPDYAWVQASWGYDLILYPLFTWFGFWGPTVAAALVSTGIFMLLIQPMTSRSAGDLIFLAVLFLSQTIPLYASSFRSQTPSSLMFAILLTILTPESLRTSRKIWALPILFLIWANLHGGFALGLILTIIIWLSSGLLRLIPRKRWVIVGTTVAISLATPLMNPWGLRIYEETVKHSTNVNLALISEWLPITTSSLHTGVFLLVFASLIATSWKRRKLEDLPFIFAYFIVSYMALTALRFTILFGIMTTWYMARHAKLKDWVSSKYISVTRTIGTIALVLIVFFDLLITKQYFIFSLPQLLEFSWHTYCEFQQACSEEITDVMRADPPKGVGFNPYNYGGYLAWRVPDVKTFTDGRMAAWKNDRGEVAPVFDADRIYEDSKPLMFRRFDGEYHFAWMIIPTQSTLHDFLEKNPEWEVRYRDERFYYYVKRML